MRRFLGILALLLVCVSLTVDAAQGPRLRTRARGASAGGGGGGDTLAFSDYAYLGAYALPRSTSSGGQTVYGCGLTLRRESSDLTNPVHLISGAYSATNSVGGDVFEWRDATPTSPGSPYDTSSYSEATILKDYGNIYSGNRTVYYNGNYENFGAGSPPMCGFYWDDTGSKLYHAYGDTYDYTSATGHDQPSLVQCTLDYAGETGSCAGPWWSGSQLSKSLMGGVLGIPTSFATTYLGDSTKRLGWGFGGYGSIVATRDASLGPSLSAFVPPAGGATTNVGLTTTPLVGYWPTQQAFDASHGRMTRPAWILPGNADADGIAWGTTKTWWLDYVYGGAWIHDATRSGALFVGNLGLGQASYIESQIAGEYHRHYWMIYSEADLATVALGANRYSIQPTVTEVQYPSIDYTGQRYDNPVSANVSTITASGSDKLCASQCLAGASTGALVTTATAHGFSVSDYVSVRGTSSAADYDRIWVVDTVPSSTTMRIRDANQSTSWAGTSATGGTVRRATNGPEVTLGVVEDPVTQKLYVAVSKVQGVNNADGKVIVHVYGRVN